MEFRDKMLKKGDVEKLDIVTNKNIVRVYIKKDSLSKPYYKDKFEKNWPSVRESKGPHFEFTITKADEFEKGTEHRFLPKNPDTGSAL